MSYEKLSALINVCLLPKLSKKYYECDYHAEYHIRENNLKQHFAELIYLIQNINISQSSEITSSLLSSILILYLELGSESYCKVENSEAGECSVKMNSRFKERYLITIDEILKSHVFNAQKIFEVTLKELHKKMIVDDFKKYPGIIGVYCMLMKNIQDYKVTLTPSSVLPISLILIEDYNNINKIKGLQCCSAILKCLTAKEFTNGNYYEVVYSCLKKNVFEKDIDVTRNLLGCILGLLRILPLSVRFRAAETFMTSHLITVCWLLFEYTLKDPKSPTLHIMLSSYKNIDLHQPWLVQPNRKIKKNKLDDIHSILLDQLNTESNLYRKAECFMFLSKIIHMHEINCVKKKKMFMTVVYDNINICADDAVREILLKPVIECLHNWITYCWPVWKLSTDKEILSSLFKSLYTCQDEDIISHVQNIIVTLILLSTKDGQEQILENLDINFKCSNLMFLKSIEAIKQHIKGYLFLIYLPRQTTI